MKEGRYLLTQTDHSMRMLKGIKGTGSIVLSVSVSLPLELVTRRQVSPVKGNV